MNDKVKVSNYDAIATQIYLWMVTAFAVLFVVFLLLGGFNLSEFLIALMVSAAFVSLHYHSYNFWNIWYENGEIHFKNLYRKQTVSIERFKKVQTIARYEYGLYLDDNKVYVFWLGPVEDFKLFFKWDTEYYAKAITATLLELKNNRSKD